MTPPDFSDREIKWLVAIPLQFPATAGEIANRAGVGNGQNVAAFAKRNPRLVQRQFSGAGFYYRLSEQGRSALARVMNRVSQGVPQ